MIRQLAFFNTAFSFYLMSDLYAQFGEEKGCSGALAGHRLGDGLRPAQGEGRLAKSDSVSQ